MNGSQVMMGQAGAVDGAVIWQLARGADDAGTSFNLFARSNWFAPVKGGGTCVYYDAFITITWTMAASLRFKSVIDNVADIEKWDGGTLEAIEVALELPAQASGQRRTQTFRIPLQRSLKAAGLEETRNHIVGTRMQLLLSSVGGLGAGDLIFDGTEIEYEELVDQKPAEG